MTPNETIPVMQTAAPPSVVPSPLRAWLYLIWLSFQRQARARQMVWMAIGLLILAVGGVALLTARHDWAPRRLLARAILTNTFGYAASASGPGPIGALPVVVSGALTEWLAFLRFSRSMVFGILMGFLLPIWSLSFATQAFGGDREERSLLWLLSRPMPRPAIYLAKYIALLPWTVTLNVGGFALLCLVAGPAGRLAFALYWPAVFLGTLAYAALFHLMGAVFWRPAVVALVYTFFVETFAGSMPGAMKRISISFFDRCLMMSAAERFHIPPPAPPDIYMPVSGMTAGIVLGIGTVLLLAIGAALFARREYSETT
jgi:ABC-2 type transport system permease protein